LDQDRAAEPCRLGIANNEQVRAMSEHYLGSLPSGDADGDSILIEPFAPAQRRFAHEEVAHEEVAHEDLAHQDLGDAGLLAQTVREQLARDYADIERATAALRRGEPALESWIKPPLPITPKPRPLWLLNGVLWLSTALVTAGAVVAIASLAG
jgi:hypothetical protein